MALSIDSLLKQKSSDLKKTQKKLSRSESSEANKSSTFAQHLEISTKLDSSEDVKENIGILRKLVDSAGEELERNPTLGNYHLYRALLGDIVKRVVRGSLEVKNVGTGLNPSDRHQIISHIDQEAEQLLELVISEQKNRLKITASIDTIKGLVIDLLS